MEPSHAESHGTKFDAGPFLLACLFLTAGFSHFVFSAAYLRIMPPFLPWPTVLLEISGVAEILGGGGLLLSRWRRPAAYGLIALLVAVFPANVYMAVAHVSFPGILGTSWAQWLRLPLQIPLIYWAWRYTRR